MIGAVIPCRTGSKGIPGKNFKFFSGKPLWEWTFDAAIYAEVFDKIIVSSDGGLKKGDENINSAPFPEDLIFPYVVLDNDRPAALSDDKATLDDLLIHYAIKYPEVDTWCLLQPTSPLRTADDIKAAYAMLQETDKQGEPKYDSVVSVYNHPIIGWVANSAYHKGRKMHTALYHTNKRPNRQDRKDWFLENGAVYFVTIAALQMTNARVGMSPALYVMPQERSVEIDSQLDWELCEWLAGRVA